MSLKIYNSIAHRISKLKSKHKQVEMVPRYFGVLKPKHINQGFCKKKQEHVDVTSRVLTAAACCMVLMVFSCSVTCACNFSVSTTFFSRLSLSCFSCVSCRDNALHFFLVCSKVSFYKRKAKQRSSDFCS